MTDNGGAARRSGRRWLWIIAGLAGAGAVAAVVAIWHLPDRMYPGGSDGAAQARAALQGGLLTAAAALTAVAGALIALDETRQANAEVKAANAETKRSNEAADLRERSANANTHVREFYVAAIGLLSSDTVDGRLGGLYALERLANDSPDDQRTVVEVLSAFVREHARPPSPVRAPPAPTTPTTDVQAALTILGRLPARENVPRADLTRVHLAGARLGGANLTGARLGGANLTGASLDGADLTGASLGGADLTGASLGGANLTDAGLGGANLTGAWLRGANLTDVWLVAANLTEVRGLSQGQVDVTFGNGGTQLPGGVTRPSSWR
ncbi:pentapeptide repeat-containing protein [Pseudofrankia sp. BMG5.37]|uniref:pentapeptide repeat-containing protein n=1 Tax=Pseudofrankia sp. BMG5.37 TaxID=3050035 RepID=UPI002894EA8C|nr:pentapeptide repeat-containing protein [Pseudofrankia sp. BMG5.37]MDT3443831.1 pentapeptide repeat-containing protein [Pseudofrankia sp. BMG5.37]